MRWRNSGTRTGKDRGHGGGAGEGRASQAPLKRGGLPPKSRESPEQVQSRPGDTISPLAAVTSKARRGQRSCQVASPGFEGGAHEGQWRCVSR